MTDTLAVKEMVFAQQGYMKDMRREFHKHPEISGEEHHTREILVREIKSMDIPYRLLPGTGIIAVIKGENLENTGSCVQTWTGCRSARMRKT